MALHSYISPATRKALVPRVEVAFSDGMLHNHDLGLRIVNFRTFTSIAETPRALQQIKDLLDGKLIVPGLQLKPFDRWNLIGHLIAMNDPEDQNIYVAERATTRAEKVRNMPTPSRPEARLRRSRRDTLASTCTRRRFRKIGSRKACGGSTPGTRRR
jgi:hypothetical protein